MRPISVGSPPQGQDNAAINAKLDWCIMSIQQIAEASQQQTEELFDVFDPSNVTETRSFDADTVTVAELADVVGTLFQDIKGREI